MQCLAGAMFATQKRVIAFVFEPHESERRGSDDEDYATQIYVRKTFKRIQKLGQGSSGEVWKVRKVKTGETFALKKIRKRFRNHCEIENQALEAETTCLRELHHPNIVSCMETIESNCNLWIVMEYCEGGELYQRLAELRHFPERSARRIVKQVLDVVHHMHSYGVVHRDLKLENILLTSKADDASIKIADLGLAFIREHGLHEYRPRDSMQMKDATFITMRNAGSPICMAPEVAHEQAAYGPQCDIWSVGCITFELISGQPPFLFSASTQDEILALVRSEKCPNFFDKIWLDVSSMAKDIVTQMLAHDPKDRPSASEALQHDWFQIEPDSHMIAIDERGKESAMEPEDSDVSEA